MKQQNIEQRINDTMTKLTFVLLAIVILNAAVESYSAKDINRKLVSLADKMRNPVTQYDEQANRILEQYSEQLDEYRRAGENDQHSALNGLETLLSQLRRDGYKLEKDVQTLLDQYNLTEYFPAVRRLRKIIRQASFYPLAVNYDDLPTLTSKKNHLVEQALLAIDEFDIRKKRPLNKTLSAANI